MSSHENRTAHVRTRPGRPYPLGATWNGHGVNFSLFSGHAAAVELCLFDRRDATVEAHRITMPEQTEQVWHGYLPDIRPGQLYGYRVAGPYDPTAGHRFNPAKLLLDPYATQIGRSLIWHDALCDEPLRNGGHGTPDSRDTAPWAPLGVVADPAFDWGADRPPRTPWPETGIHELHVKGFTWRHPEVPDHLRGTYRGLASELMLHHLQALGVTAVELLPVHRHAPERALVDRGMTNYWGYNSLGFLAPDIRYATSADTAVQEFKTMVRRLHAAGLEVILDVVYNHTAEGDRHGPTLVGGLQVAQFGVSMVGNDAEPPLAPVSAGAVATLNTHDTATFAGYLDGTDIDDRASRGLLDPSGAAHAHARRRRERAALARLPVTHLAAPDEETRILQSRLGALARSAADLVLVNLKDLWRERRPQNVPGTGPERPNWRRRAQHSLEAFAAMSMVNETLRWLAHVRMPRTPRTLRTPPSSERSS